MEKLLIHGDLDAAHKKASLASAQFSERDPEWAWKFRLIDARVLLREGKNEEVLSMLSTNLPSRFLATDIDFERTVLQAWAYTSLGQRDEAEHALQQAEQLSDSSQSSLESTSSLRSQAFSALGTIYLEQADLDHADKIFHRSLDLAHKQNDVYQQASMLINLGVVALRRERFDEALDWSDEAARAAKKVDARSLLEKSQGNIAWATYKLGNFEDALAGFRTAEHGARAVDEAWDSMEWLNDIGISLYRLGHVQEAETYYKSALQIAESYKDVEIEVEAHVALAELLLQLGNIDLSMQHAEKALSIAHSAGRGADEMDALFLTSLIAARQKDTEKATQILHSLDESPTIKPSLLWQVEGALANLYADTNQPGLADKWYRESIATFESQRQTIKKEESKLPFSTNASQLYDDYIHFLVNHQKTDQALQWLDLGRARTLEEGLGVASSDFSTTLKKSVDARATARKLNGTILVYSLAPAESYLWAVTPSGTHFFQLPGEAEIDAHVKNYQRAILDSKDTLANAYVDGMDLYKILVEPAQNLIPKDSRVFIIPDGSLQTLNFETLLAPGGGLHYWLEDATITNASSLKLLAAFRPEARTKAPKKLLLIGDPISPDDKFPDLPNASDEVSYVAKHFPAGDEFIFTQKQALPSAYAASVPGQFSYIHFVAHGTSSSASPLDSAIVLTRNPANPDSFKLYARDVIQHPLHANLVTVSACYGSGSRAYGGEGLVGLSWAFLRAGSHYVVGSLWEVSDAATPQLMDQMYSLLATGRNPDAALREAKLALMRSKGVYRKPLYWATFQLYGGA